MSDTENRLVQTFVRNPTTSCNSCDEGDGKRVKSTLNTGSATTSIFVGNYYEVSSGTVRKYYYSGGQRVAMRDSGVVKFLLTDHLGSTNFSMSSGGAWLGSVRYLPFGSVVQSSGTTTTRYKYTGQPEADAGLYDYGARFYDPSLGRFIQPDTIVPPGMQGYDRYAYSYGNPVKYSDPSGHEPKGHGTCYDPEDPECKNSAPTSNGLQNETAHPDAPPDFDNPLPDGNPPPPHVDGLPDDQWEWNKDWPDVGGKGYRNKQDPTETVWRPDGNYENKAGTEGELPHWNGRVPGDTGKGVDFPGNTKWGRPGQPKQPGVFTPGSDRYAYAPTSQGFPINIPILPIPNPTNLIPTVIMLLLLTPILIFAP